MKSLIVTADDFGLAAEVNEAVEIAHTRGILGAASLMVGAPAAADAVARAKRLPGLRVGLHLVLVEGVPVLPTEKVPGLVGADGRFRDDMTKAGIAMFFSPSVRRQLAAEIEAQFAAFAATGLVLDHVNAHKHFHVHPTIGRTLLEVGARYGLSAVRVPDEPRELLARVEARPPKTDFMLRPYAALLRRRLRKAGLASADRVVGVAWSGAMTTARIAGTLRALPEGCTELYVHPATRGGFAGAAPGYAYADELAALTAPETLAAWHASGAVATSFGELGTGHQAIAGRRAGVKHAGRWIALAGLVLAGALFVRDGLEPIARLLVAAGWGLVLAGLFHVLPMLVNARAWQALLVPTARTPLPTMSAAVWIRESVNGLLPVARIGGEIACYRLLVQRGTPRVVVAASLIVDMAVSLLSQGVFCLVGVALLVARGTADRFAVKLALAFAVLAVLGIAFAVLQRAGLFEKVARLANRLVAGRWDDLEQHSARIDRATRLIYRRRQRVVVCFTWQVLGWLLGAGEIWLALHFLGHEASIGDAVILEAIVQAISSVAFVVPGALGVQEGGFLLLGAALGLDGPTSLALAAARRIRDAVVFFPGLVAWQFSERKR